MRNFLVLIFLLVSSWLGGLLPCQGQSVYKGKRDRPRFRHISLPQGLSQSTIFCMAQDTLGALWFGTQDGLNRYDGVDFEVFQNRINDSFSLQSNVIRALYIDPEGGIWIGGNEGVSRYDYPSRHFYNYRLPHQHTEWFVSAITADSSGAIWMGVSNGEIWIYHKKTDALKKVYYPASEFNIKNIIALVVDREQLWLGTDVGLFSMRLKDMHMRKIQLGNGITRINSLVRDQRGGKSLWIGTESQGLIHYDYANDRIRHYRHRVEDPNSLADDRVRTAAFDPQGRLWIGTFQGLSILDPETDSFLNLFEDHRNPHSLSQNSVRSILRDAQNGMWLGTYYGGINYYHPHDIKFNSIVNYGRNPSLNDNVVSVVKEDAAGNLWIGTNDGGLNYWDKQTNTISYYVHKSTDPQTLSSDNIKSIAFDNSGNVLIGTHDGGLNRFDPTTGRSIVFKHDEKPQSIADNMVYALLKDHRGRIWVGTRKGLDLFMEEEQSFIHVYIDKAGKRLSSDEITFLFEDSKDRIWVGTTNGINIFYPDNNLFEPLTDNEKENGLSNGFVTCVNEDNAGHIWIGTKNGLNRFNEDSRTFIRFTTKEGLPNNVIYGILPDNDNNLWISTNKGLACMEIETRRIRTFTVYDGLQSNQFNMYSYCKTSTGVMLFGGIKGISFFLPDNVRRDSLRLALQFTGLQTGNRPVLSGDETGILQHPITMAHRLTFKPDYRQFRIAFRTFNYITPQKVEYAYKLLGFDEDWRTTRRPTAYYSNLPFGDYTFQVKARGPMGQESPVIEMAVRILPPWYQTILAYVIFALLLLFVLFFIVRMIHLHTKERNQLRMERLEKQKLVEVNRMKAEFFTNISHEFRTPLTLIISPLEELLRGSCTDERGKKQLHLVYTNARRLLHLVDQLLDFRKAGYGKLELNLEQQDLVGFIHGIYLSFTALAKKKNIAYTFQSEERCISTLFDSNYLEKAIFNLLSNAFKFTPDSGSIHIGIRIEKGWAEIRVQDSGCGIPAKFQSLIFERFYRIDETHSSPGSGIGLALTKKLIELHQGTINMVSAPDKGASFTVRLPLPTNEVQAVLAKDRDRPGSEYLQDTALYDVPKPVAVLPQNQTDNSTTILVVDDHPEMLRYVADCFSTLYTIKTAADGKEALDSIAVEPPDFIVCDIMMPVLDGMKLCTQLKKNIQTCHIPLILLTAKGGIDNQIDGLDHGADDYIIKPFSMKFLLAKVENILRSRRRLKDHYSNQLEVIPENIAVNALDEGFLKEAMKVVEENLDDPAFSVDVLSKGVCMSRSNLYLKLKAITGESASDFIKRIRFNKAILLIEQRKYTIAEVAYMVGFSSPSYFSTSFKNYFGYLPTEHLRIKPTDPVQ